MKNRLNRRALLRIAGGTLLNEGLWALSSRAAAKRPTSPKGCVVGQPEGARAGMEVLHARGNVVDAIVAAALVAGVVSVQNCGPGGYGGHMILALQRGKKVTAIDFNSAAPAAARNDLFRADKKGAVPGNANVHGWLAAGVPGTLAGLQLALDRYGTLSFRQAVQPALRYARDGFPVNEGLAGAIRSARPGLQKDPGSAKLLLAGGEVPAVGSLFSNPDLANLLEVLARENSVAPFYRGAIARRIAAAFQQHGGLVTEEDLASYKAREVQPLQMAWRRHTIYTAPLTAGGLTVLQALTTLRALSLEKLDPAEPKTTQTRLEALRLAWSDRLRLLGDPEHAKVPVDRLLSEEYAREQANLVEKAVREGKAAVAASDGRIADGTVHLSAADSEGNLAALTLTHGGAFGAQVIVEGLGLILGHGMSRFDPRADHPNAPGPGKRPLHNMCPTVVLREGTPVLSLGARGGRRIPNAVFEVLVNYVALARSMPEALAAQRLHTEGDLRVILEGKWPSGHGERLKRVGYAVEQGTSAVVSAVVLESEGGCRGATR
jgi:gamma-glutamyltranspeptidase/glutathione hydrolase